MHLLYRSNDNNYTELALELTDCAENKVRRYLLVSTVSEEEKQVCDYIQLTEGV